MSTADGDRQLVRLLRLLELAGGQGRACRTEGDSIVFEHAGRPVRFAGSLLDSALRAGLAGRDGSRLKLLDAGTARLRRLQFPDHAYLGQHAPLAVRTVAGPQGSRNVLANEGESPLARLFLRRTGKGTPYLSASQFAAGERLRGDFERGRLQPRVSASWERSKGSGSRQVAAEISDFAIDARRRVERALDSLEAGLAGVALDVCCFLKGLEQVERERRWPPRSAKLMLATALSVLASHYGLEGRAAGGRRPILQWGDETYRPVP